MSTSYVVNVDGAVEREGRFLLIRRGQDEDHAAGQLSLPGGTVETSPGESDALARTLRRELREEVGIDVTDRIRLVESTTFELDGGGTCLNVVLLAHHDAGTARPVADDEVEAVEWRTPERILDDPDVPPWTKQSIERAAELESRSG